MKKSWMSLVMALGGAVVAVAKPSFVEGELLVKFRPSGAAIANVYHSAIGAVQIGDIPQIGVQHIKLPPNVSVKKAVDYYRKLGIVEYAEPNVIAYPDATVNDPMVSQQYSISKMRVPLAWDLTTGTDDVIVAVLDTGVDYTHPDLAGKVIKGRDFANGDDDPMDEDAHGTHVAGIIGAKTNNGVGIAGVGYNVSILAIRVIGAGHGTGDTVAQGIVYAADRGASVMNMSFGSYSFSQAWQDAVNYAWNKGVVIFATAGNDNITTKRYPGAYDRSIGVGSTDKNDQKSGFSNYGADWVDVAGPGTDVLSTVPGGYELFSGTSMACPNAAGVASLMISYAGKGVMTNAEIREIIENTAVPVGNWVAKGRVDAFAAVSQAVRPINEVRGPATAKMFDGSAFNGSAQSLWTNDNARFNVFSRVVPSLGSVAGAEIAFAYNFTASRFISGSLAVRASSKLNATQSIYIKRNNGQYDLLKSFPSSGSEVTRTVPLPKSVAPYLSAGKLTFVVRDVVPTRYGSNTFVNAMNTAVLTTKTSSRVTP